MEVKLKDRRAGAFIRDHGERCAEVDALPPSELRARVLAAIEGHVDQERWSKLQEIERLEQATLDQMMKAWNRES